MSMREIYKEMDMYERSSNECTRRMGLSLSYDSKTILGEYETLGELLDSVSDEMAHDKELNDEYGFFEDEQTAMRDLFLYLYETINIIYNYSLNTRKRTTIYSYQQLFYEILAPLIYAVKYGYLLRD